MTRKPHHDLPAIPEVSTPHEIEDDADDGATIESFAFTLDGVGFDEESGSIMHTPPQLLSPRKMTHRDEVELHRQTCQTLGIPCTEEMSVGSPRESVPESLESTSTTSVTKNIALYDVNLNSPKNSAKTISPNGCSEKKSRLITRAKITELTSSYANSVKEMALNFSAKSKNLYAMSKQKVLTQGDNTINKNHQISFDPSKYYPKWFIEMNPLMKLTAGMALFFFTLFIVVIVAVSRTSSPHPIEGDGTHLMDMASLSSALNGTSSITNVVATAGHVSNETSMPSYVPTFSPTASPTGEEANNCIDKPGNYKTSRGKLRSCSWMKEKHLERECGALNKEPSELGLNCKLSCSEYNSCVMEVVEETETPTSTPTAKPTNKKRKNQNKNAKNSEAISTTTSSTTSSVIEDDGNVYFIDTNNKLRPCSWLDIRHPAVQAKRRDENCPNETVQAVCPVPCLDYVKFDVPTTVAATTTTAAEYEEMTFSDSNGQQRPCSWLDVRNSRQRTKRRDEHCTKITVQIICPESCEDYEDYSIPVTVNKQKRSDDSSIIASEYVRSHDVVPQDECFDISGYFLNDIGHPVECAWLNENDEEADMRKDRNCGGLYSATDLGVMCRHSCGTC